MSWRSLELGERNLPRLLVKTRLNKDGYDIQLTDLGRIWGERIGKREIVERANDEGCSIDPSEDDQYGILLKKIESALKGDPRTTLDLHSHKDTDTLQLNLSAPLPGSLPTFVWRIMLERQPDAAIGTGLVTPLISQAVQLRSQIQHLIDELASKDRVIAKITDRLEASGNDLTAVFPGASGIKISRKKSQRGQLASHVKGLADFDEGVWRNSVKQGESSVNLSSEILSSVLEHLPVAGAAALEGDWWVDLPNPGTKGQQPRAQSAASQASQRGGTAASQHHITTANGHQPLSTEESVDEDEFQRQGTPPQLKKPDDPPADEDEETDDDDLDNPPSKASSSQTKGRSQQHDEPKSTPAARRLGILGGRKSKSPRPKPPHETEPEPEAETEDEEPSAPKPTARGKLGAFGGKRAPSPESARDPEPEPEPELVQQSPAKINSKLGTFGGSSRAAVVSVEPADLEQHDTTSKPKLGTFGGKGKGSADSASVKAEPHDDEALPSPVKGRLGRMGGKGEKKSEESNAAETQVEAQKQAREAEEKEEQERLEREDSQERADKKRERLKRELEEKAKGPTKKKRKF